MVKHALASIMFSVVTADVFAALVFSGSSDKVITIIPPASTGLEAVYVVRNSDGIVISDESGSSARWSTFSSSGAAYSQAISTGTSISMPTNDTGIAVELGDKTSYYWIINYDNHKLNLDSAVPSDIQNDCSRTELNLSGTGDRIVYYTINGRSEEINREISISYSTLVYDPDNAIYRQTEEIQTIPYVRSVISVPAPLCDTRFTVSGDRFLQSWGIPVEIESPTLTAYAVSAETSATQQQRDIDNEQNSDTSELGGSAPCEIDFAAVVTDGAVFYEWQISRNPEFEPIDDRYTQLELDHSFREQGTFYVRFFAANSSGECEYTGDVYTVSIGASNILCPNAFTPESSPGVNDEWKVSYKSITSFECHIFNRWGVEMFSFTDPSIGWDGKYNGKYVPAGTYYYVIKAHGADGRDYKLSGDINIIKSNDKYSSGSQTE